MKNTKEQFDAVGRAVESLRDRGAAFVFVYPNQDGDLVVSGTSLSALGVVEGPAEDPDVVPPPPGPTATDPSTAAVTDAGQGPAALARIAARCGFTVEKLRHVHKQRGRWLRTMLFHPQAPTSEIAEATHESHYTTDLLMRTLRVEGLCTDVRKKIRGRNPRWHAWALTEKGRLIAQLPEVLP